MGTLDLFAFGQHRTDCWLAKNVNCVFRGRPGEPDEAYTGTMTTDRARHRRNHRRRYHLGGVCRHRPLRRACSAGTYAGATAEVSVAAGLGANVLVGGSHRTVALQPLSVQGQIGLNIAAGIGALELHPLR